MKKHALSILLVLALCFSTFVLAQDKVQKEVPKPADKMGMAKEEMKMGPLKSVSCPPSCGFMCRSHDEKELTSVVKLHAKKMHKMEMTDKQVKDMMKSEESAPTKN